VDNLTFINRVAESSPVIIAIMLAGYIACWHVLQSLLRRLDRKDAQLLELNNEMLTAVAAVTKAVERLTDSILYRNSNTLLGNRFSKNNDDEL
jgi:hypothetical protein